MPTELPLINGLLNIQVGFEKLFLLIKWSSKRVSMFYTSQEEIALNAFCRDQVKPLLNELLDHFDGFQNLFQRDIKEMKDVFEQNDVYLDEIERQNDLVVTQQESQTNKTKNVLSSTGMNATSSVKRPKSRDSHVKTSVLDVSKNEAKKEAVYVRKNKQTDNTFAKVVSNKENVIDVDVANASKEKTLLCVLTSASKARDKVSSAFKKKKRNMRDKPLSPFMLNKIRTSRLWQKWFESQPNVMWTPVNTKPHAHTNPSNTKPLVSGVLKHMTGDRSLLRNFVEKFMGTVRFGNDNFAAITGYDMAASSPICLMSKATSTKSWLWHRRLSHLNFGTELESRTTEETINDLTKLDLVDGLPKFKYGKDHLCSACERGKSKKASHPPKLIPSDYSKLELLHMDLCGLMRVASVNGKKYILVIVDDFSRFKVGFIFSVLKDETPENHQENSLLKLN
ncbi:retrovirus-related pol polyprotein from transposon TNT 1-94 [Tanacetum coccineum]